MRMGGATTIRATLLVAASAALALGVTQPLVRLERLWLLESEASLLDIVRGLWAQGEALLALVVALVSVAFPALKLVLVQALAMDGAVKPPRWLQQLSKWSMMDVVLVALAIFAAKTSGLAVAGTMPGLWFYAASAALALAAHALGGRDPVPAWGRPETTSAPPENRRGA